MHESLLSLLPEAAHYLASLFIYLHGCLACLSCRCRSQNLNEPAGASVNAGFSFRPINQGFGADQTLLIPTEAMTSLGGHLTGFRGNGSSVPTSENVLVSAVEAVFPMFYTASVEPPTMQDHVPAHIKAPRQNKSTGPAGQLFIGALQRLTDGTYS